MDVDSSLRKLGHVVVPLGKDAPRCHLRGGQEDERNGGDDDDDDDFDDVDADDMVES